MSSINYIFSIFLTAFCRRLVDIAVAHVQDLHQSHILMKFSKNRYNNVGHFHNVVSLISVRQKHRVFERET